MTDSAVPRRASAFRARQTLGLGGLLHRMAQRLSNRQIADANDVLSLMATDISACDSGAELSSGLKLFHDADWHRPGVGKTANSVRIDSAAFDGSYVSLAIDLPADQAARIRVGTELVVTFSAHSDRALPVFLRAHFRNDEGSEVLHDLIVIEAGARSVRFNLDGLRIPIDKPTTAWVDLILSDPTGTEVSIDGIRLDVRRQ
ncbi:MAG: DUF6478 family protein [Paracoccaceae bacterium]